MQAALPVEAPKSKVPSTSTHVLCEKFPIIMDAKCPVYPSEFGHRFRTVAIPGATSNPIIEILPGNLCRNVDISQVASAIVCFSHANVLTYPEFRNTCDHNDALRVAKAWRSVTVPIGNSFPTTCVFKSDQTLAYERMTFDPTEEMGPCFIDFLSRMSQPDAFCWWVWSLFEPKSDRAQWFWLHGDGGEGKSSVVKVIMRAMGAASVIITSNEIRTGRFWQARLLGKRLVYVPEAAPTFPRGNEMKFLTGDSKLVVERKGRDGFEAENHAKFLFVSNDAPEIGGDKATRRRALYSDVKMFTGPALPEAEYEEQLWKEIGGFLGHCRKIYQEAGASSLVTPQHMLDDVIDDYEAPAIQLFETAFETELGAYAFCKDVDAILKQAGILGTRQKSDCYAVWNRRFDVVKCSKWIDGKSQKVLFNCKILPNHQLRYLNNYNRNPF